MLTVHDLSLTPEKLMILEITNMKRGNPNRTLRVWFDVRFNDYYYVLRWLKGSRPYLYRSKDATPTNAKWYFGRRAAMQE